MLRIFLPHLDGWNAARREAAARYAELGLAEVAELPADEPGHVYHMYCVRSFERDRLAAALAGGRDRLRLVLRAAAPSPACAPLSRLLGGRPPRDGEGRAREPLPADVGRDQRGAAGRGRRRPAGAHRVSSRRDLVPGQPASPLAVRRRRRADRGGLVARVLPHVRPDGAPRTTGTSCRGRSSRSSSRSSSSSSRSSASTTAGGATSRPATCGALLRGVTVACVVSTPRPLRVPAGAHLASAEADRRARLPAPARVRRRHAAARPVADRAARRRDRGARQGGARRRRRRRGPAARARDAAQPLARLHADRLRRRRPAQDGPPHPRRARARDDRRARPPDPRPPAGRGADRDAVGAGRAAPQDRRDGPRARASS